MPRADGTGPFGVGPTGWRRNGCAGVSPVMPGGGMGYGPGRGPGRGLGFNRGPGLGRGIGSRWLGWNLPVENTNSEYLNAQAKNLEEQAAHLRKLAEEKKQAE